MAEPQPGAAEGFYTPEERLYQLQGKLYRDLRVRIDTGIHTNRMSYADAVDLFSEIVDFLPASAAILRRHSLTRRKRAAVQLSARSFVTQSGRRRQSPIDWARMNLRASQRGKQPARRSLFSRSRFHVLFMKQGTIPSGYFREELLREIGETK
jgi:hypothetical protein